MVAAQEVFGETFNAEASFKRDGSQSDHLFSDGDEFTVANLFVSVLHTPGHTPACIAYIIGEAAFVGDTFFMPDYGTARTDFPGRDAQALYKSIQRILALAPDTTLYVCHDYGTAILKEFRFERRLQIS
ncbi:MAG: glyoxylase-like metal-dependent hydrolase (beta-lactamase superfamily II) [Candidatus Azotimanducaceae bacterium]